MRFSSLKFFRFSMFLWPMIISGTFFSLYSCGSKREPGFICLNKEFVTTENQFLDNGWPKFEESADNNSSLVSISENSGKAIKRLEQYKKDNQSKLSINEKIWLDSYIEQWKIKKGNVEKGLVFLGANPITSGKVLSMKSNWLLAAVTSAINIYPINPDTSEPDLTKKPDEKLVKSLSKRVKETKKLIDQTRRYLMKGATYGFMPSTIAKKLLINQLLNTFYKQELLSFAKSENKQTDICCLIGFYYDENANYFTDIQKRYFSEVDTLKDNFGLQEEIKDNFFALKKALDDFVIFYSGKYFSNEYAYPEKFPQKITLESLKDNQNSIGNEEKEKTLFVTDAHGTTYKIYGVGITEKDLSAKNVGIGHMKLDYKFGENKVSGNDVYQQMLLNNNSIDRGALEISELGAKKTNQGKTNMSNLAQKALKLIRKTENVNSDDDFTRFNKWLNNDDFFWGREKLSEEEYNKNYDKYWLNPDEKVKKFKDVIAQLGYDEWVKLGNENKPIDGKPNAVIGKRAIVGAVISLIEYNQFKLSTDKLYDSLFKKIFDYKLSPYNYIDRFDAGVGLEGPRESRQFKYNCDPYYSLPKWSISSLITHEGKMGHHTQQEYWTEYLPDKTYEGPGYTFVNEAFHEGWAVFTEWLANEAHVYGTDLDKNHMPKDWTQGNGLVPKFDESKIDLLKQTMQNLHGGVYWKSVEEGDEQVKNSIQLANMLQYYGFLNEAQLRNMRLILDVSYHFVNKDNNANVITLKSGSSINDIREYMRENSALGDGDIESESYRYLLLPAQATGYMIGEDVIQNLYEKVEKISNASEKVEKNWLFTEDKTKIQNFFDLVLRNGEIPLTVLESTIKNEYKLS